MNARRAESRAHRTQRRHRLRVLVVCGGKTEQRYLAGLQQIQRDQAVDIKIKTKPVAPHQVVEYACRLASQADDDFDKVWCVVDVDEFDINSAVRAAESLSVELAVSNPCFELWLLLHFEDCTSHVDGYRDAERRLARHVPNYKKGQLAIKHYVKTVDQAISRARSLTIEVKPHTNPSTGVWRLAEQITKPDPW